MERKASGTLDAKARQAALANPDDILLELSYPSEEEKFFDHLEHHRRDIEGIVAWHLKLGDEEIPHLSSRIAWLRGNFNINIPVRIENWSRKPHERVLIRIPLAHKLGETKFEGNVDEKLRCEVATFLWLLNKHPSVPVPFLWGFGFSDGSSFTSTTADRFKSTPKQAEDVDEHFQAYKPTSHVQHDHFYDFKLGYLIMEFIEETNGQLLSRYWSMGPEKQALRLTFLTDLSRMMLELASTKFTKIGSLKFDDQGFVSLTNRPLHFRLQQLENKGVSTGIARSEIYEEARSYFLDLLGCHEQRIRYQRNSIKDEADAELQFAVQAAMRAILPHVSRKEYDRGPFFFRLTDVHPNNVMVNETGRIKYFIDLEWAVVHPAEFFHPPVWLSGQKVDQLVRHGLKEYLPILHEFLEVFEKEERAIAIPPNTQLTDILKWNWESEAMFYFQGLENPKTCCTLILQHILPKYGFDSHSEKRNELINAWASLWGLDRHLVIEDRLNDRMAYLNELENQLE